MTIDTERLKTDAAYWDGCRDAIHEETGAAITKVHLKPRPIRTKEQRQRDDLLEILYKDEPVEVIADAILSRYNLEPKL